jgi:hypothetical protein
MELQRPDRHSLHNPQLLTPLLHHPSFSQDQHIIAALQATSKQLQTAVAQQPAGQLPVVLCTDAPGRMQALAQWLQKHAGLCQGLDLKIIHSCDKNSSFYANDSPRVKDVRWLDAVAAVATALQDAAAATRTVKLQSLSLTGSIADAALLQQMPLQQLTQLCVEVDYSSSASLQAVAALTGLRSLQLMVSERYPRRAADGVLAPLADLQQLTQLHSCPVRLAQLKQLPPKLQQLHVIIHLDYDVQQLAQLANWLQQHSGIVKSLRLQNGPDPQDSAPFKAAMEKLVASIQAATSHDRVGLDSLDLVDFNSTRSAGPLLQQLPACSLTQLKCSIYWGSADDVDALCSLTSLRSLHVAYCVNTLQQRDDVLMPLSALQRLTQLQLSEVRSAQLAVLQLPQLQRLGIYWCEFAAGQQLQLGHLTALQQLQLLDYSIRHMQRDRGQTGSRALEHITLSSAGAALQQQQQLPPNLRELQWLCGGEGLGYSVQQLLQLTRLQKLVLLGTMPDPEQQQQLLQLTSLVRLTEIGISCSSATAAACCALPIKALSITSDDATPAVLQQLGTFSGLTHFTISGRHLPTTLGRLSSMLAQLTALQHVSIAGFNTTAADRPARLTRPSRSAAEISSIGGGKYAAGSAGVGHNAQDIAMLLRAVGCLPDVGSGRIELPVMLLDVDVRQLKELVQEQLPAWLPSFRVSKPGHRFRLRLGYRQGW